MNITHYGAVSSVSLAEYHLSYRVHQDTTLQTLKELHPAAIIGQTFLRPLVDTVTYSVQRVWHVAQQGFSLIDRVIFGIFPSILVEAKEQDLASRFRVDREEFLEDLNNDLVAEAWLDSLQKGSFDRLCQNLFPMPRSLVSSLKMNHLEMISLLKELFHLIPPHAPGYDWIECSDEEMATRANLRFLKEILEKASPLEKTHVTKSISIGFLRWNRSSTSDFLEFRESASCPREKLIQKLLLRAISSFFVFSDSLNYIATLDFEDKNQVEKGIQAFGEDVGLEKTIRARIITAFSPTAILLMKEWIQKLNVGTDSNGLFPEPFLVWFKSITSGSYLGAKDFRATPHFQKLLHKFNTTLDAICRSHEKIIHEKNDPQLQLTMDQSEGRCLAWRVDKLGQKKIPERLFSFNMSEDSWDILHEKLRLKNELDSSYSWWDYVIYSALVLGNAWMIHQHNRH